MADGSCEFDCPHLVLDTIAEEAASDQGNGDMATTIRREAAQRRARCASIAGGAVRLAGGQLACGLEHGNPYGILNSVLATELATLISE